MNLQLPAIAALATLCAGAAAWALVYPYLSGEKEAEKRMLSVARPGVPALKAARGVRSRREQVEATLKDLDDKRKKSSSPPLSVRLAQAGLTALSG